MRRLPLYRLRRVEEQFDRVGECHCGSAIYLCPECDGEHCSMCVTDCPKPETVESRTDPPEVAEAYASYQMVQRLMQERSKR